MHVLLVEWRPLNIVRVLALRVITGVHQPNHAYNEHTGDETPALYNAVFGVESGRFKRVLVIGVEKMNLLDTKGTTHALACCSDWPTEGSRGMTFPGLFAE